MLYLLGNLILTMIIAMLIKVSGILIMLNIVRDHKIHMCTL